ncbi:MAG TPA: translocated intimin receptor Tir [Acidobacteriaceae bacterium]|nr:translocated intimin receptor Tir [Acidobacteriaceae bacterium]
MRTRNTAKAVLTDVQFWIPVVVLIFGIVLLVWLH